MPKHVVLHFKWLCFEVDLDVDNKDKLIHVVLHFKWLCVELDLDVDDKDKLTLLDLVMNWEDECIKTNKLILKNPSFAYVWKMNHVKLNCDQDLMTMFERFNDNEMIFGDQKILLKKFHRPLLLGNAFW